MSSAQNSYNSSGQKSGVWIYINHPFDSILGSAPKIIVNYVNDTLQGRVDVYDAKGMLMFQGNFLNNKKEGTLVEYFNGYLYKILTYHKGILVTESRYLPNGKLYKTIDYSEDLKKTFEIRFYKNGRPMYKIFYSKGLAQEEINYRRNGKLECSIIYSNGVLDHFIFYNRKGKEIKK